MRTYYRASGGADAAIQGLIFWAVLLTSPVWIVGRPHDDHRPGSYPRSTRWRRDALTNEAPGELHRPRSRCHTRFVGVQGRPRGLVTRCAMTASVVKRNACPTTRKGVGPLRLHTQKMIDHTL